MQKKPPPQESRTSPVESQPSPPPKKMKARPVADSVGHRGPIADSGGHQRPTSGSVGYRGPIFFSDPEDKEPDEPEAPEESYDAFIKHIKGQMKRGNVKVSDDEEEYEDEEEPEDLEDAEDDEEDDNGYVKEESRMRPNPRRGHLRNNPPCDNCIRKAKDCITQDSSRSRGACFNCGKLKQKCIFSVS
jgi:hypothetical protein